MRDRSRGTEQSEKPRLVLFTPELDDVAGFAPQLAAVLSEADIAAVVLRLAPANEEELVARVRRLIAALPENRPAIMLEGHAHLLAKTPADGAHLNPAQLAVAGSAVLQRKLMLGAGGLHSRHDAMIAGEAGANYVLFGEPDAESRRPGRAALIERVAWWSELFVIPSVAYAGERDEIAPLVDAGADFIGLGEEAVWSSPDGAARAVAAAMQHLAKADGA